MSTIATGRIVFSRGSSIWKISKVLTLTSATGGGSQTRQRGKADQERKADQPRIAEAPLEPPP